MRELAERAYFVLCLWLGRALRSARYSAVRLVEQDGEPWVRKRRLVHAPLLIRLGGPLVRVLDTGVRVLPRPEWEERERRLYRLLHDGTVRVEADGVLLLPRLPGATLAALLEDPTVEVSGRMRAIELAVGALAALHRMGLTHGDAMAENVMVDLERGVARWFDFETVHDARRPIVWRRADDVRALLATCLLRTASAMRVETLRLILDRYGDEEVTRALAASFTSAWRRALPFHLGQAGLSLAAFRQIERSLRARLGG